MSNCNIFLVTDIISITCLGWLIIPSMTTIITNLHRCHDYPLYSCADQDSRSTPSKQEWLPKLLPMLATPWLVRFNDKMTKHGEACRRAGMVSSPWWWRHWGASRSRLNTRSRGWVLPLPGRLDKRRQRRSDMCSKACLRLAKGNAAMFLNRTPW